MMMTDSALAIPGFHRTTKSSSSSSSSSHHHCFTTFSHSLPLRNLKYVQQSRRGRGSSGVIHSLSHITTTVAGSRGAPLPGLRVRASAFDPPSPAPREDPPPPCYHLSEDIGTGDAPLLTGEDGGATEVDARLTDAEISRTIIEVNSKATLVFSGLIDDEVHENVLWPELPYLTDEHGDIYIEVDKEEDILQNLTSNDNLLQVLVGLDNIERLTEVELSGSSDIHFGMEEIADEDFDSDNDDDFEQDLVVISEDDEDDLISEPFGDWENLETMHSSHPMYFARKIVEAISNVHFDWTDPPPSGLVIQGFLRRAFVEECSIVQEKNQNCDSQRRQSAKLTPEDADKDEVLQRGTMFYKVEMISIQLVSAYGNLSLVKVQDYRQAQPDVLAHSAAKIISRLKSSGEKTTQALKSLCWRMKGIQVEEVYLTGVDSLGFDLRVCSGTQIQNLRFAFEIRAISEYAAERQLHALLFPRVQHKQQEWQQARQKET